MTTVIFFFLKKLILLCWLCSPIHAGRDASVQCDKGGRYYSCFLSTFWMDRDNYSSPGFLGMEMAFVFFTISLLEIFRCGDSRQ